LTLNNNIILTGFMGSGKSSIGRVLAKETNSYFLDTDSLIESFENRKISEIFQNDGEDAFRNMEKRVFDWIKLNVKNSIISTGGGLPMFVPEIKEAGKVIYLQVDFDVIVSRLTKEDFEKRPLFKDLKKAEELFKKRDEVYRKLSHYIIKNDNLENSVKEILNV
jgi:shikimate kinase